MISNPCVIVVCDAHGCNESTEIMLKYDGATWGIDGMFDSLVDVGWLVLEERELCPNCIDNSISEVKKGFEIVEGYTGTMYSLGNECPSCNEKTKEVFVNGIATVEYCPICDWKIDFD